MIISYPVTLCFTFFFWLKESTFLSKSNFEAFLEFSLPRLFVSSFQKYPAFAKIQAP